MNNNRAESGACFYPGIILRGYSPRGTMDQERHDEALRVASWRLEEQHGRPIDLKNTPDDYQIVRGLIAKQPTREGPDKDSATAILSEANRVLRGYWYSQGDDEVDKWMDGG